MNNAIKTVALRSSKKIDLSKKIARALFPEYKGRKIKVVERARYTMANYWDGGSRSYVKAVNLETARVVDADQVTESPFNDGAHATFEIPAGVALVEHSFFCGQDCGITIIVAPGSRAVLDGGSVPALAAVGA